jgi:hypothetical protein
MFAGVSKRSWQKRMSIKQGGHLRAAGQPMAAVPTLFFRSAE